MSLADPDLDADAIVCLTILDRSEEHTSELQSLAYLVCRLLLEKKKQRLRGLRTIPAIATLSRWAGDSSHWAPTLDPIGIAQPLDHTGRKRTALTTAVASHVYTC